ncbi:Uncharacterized protein XB16_2488 [Leptospira santarosai]|uniref:Uncharacterized protein n=1 Tax=Leptospira santarosai TaxID=28183 RepID=A0A2P1QV83_9LEPT|nr:Uncharacterized protein XB16_2488 [Leptospira santarosai]
MKLPEGPDLYRALRYYVSLELTYSVSQNLPSDP